MSRVHFVGRIIALKVAIYLLALIVVVVKPEPIVAFIVGAILGAATGIVADVIVMRREDETNPD